MYSEASDFYIDTLGCVCIDFPAGVNKCSPDITQLKMPLGRFLKQKSPEEEVVKIKQNMVKDMQWKKIFLLKNKQIIMVLNSFH